MRIAIDARLNAYRQGGISQYTRQLLTALADVAPEEQIISLQHRDQLRPLAIAPNVVRRTALTPPHHRFEQWALPVEVLLARPDVLHCPDFIAPLRRPCPAVVTIHDLAFMHYPEILDAAARAYYGRVTTNAPRADAIIAVSEATRQDIAQFLDIPIEQIDVIYEAAAPLYTRIELREGEARVLNSTPVVAGTFMLFVSTLEPRKNLPTLLQALRICLDRRPDTDYQLVIVGRRGWRDEAIFQAVRDLKLADHVLFAGGVGQYDLRWLYNACRMYINPSLYEGFGLPLLEAMACGAACLAAATSSLPEIGGAAAIYVPPLDAEQWADELMALWDDEERRAELGFLGMARAQQFSWLRAARETLKVYHRAAERIVTRAETAPMHQHARAAELLADETAGLLPTGTRAAPFVGVPGPGQPRPCLRCGADLAAGELIVGMAIQSPVAEHNGQTVAPRAWSCPHCGSVELATDGAAVAHGEHGAAIEDQPPIEPILSVAMDEGEQGFTPAIEIEVPEMQPAGSEPHAEPSFTPAIEAEVPEMQPAGSEPHTEPANTSGHEADAEATPAAEPHGEPADQTASSVAAADESTVQTGAVEPPDMSAPVSLNGTPTARKPRPARAHRSEKPAADANAAQPSKPRQSRAKRKRTP